MLSKLLLLCSRLKAKQLHKEVMESAEDKRLKLKQSICKHRWRIYGHELLGLCTCEYCNLVESLYIALDELLQKLQPK